MTDPSPKVPESDPSLSKGGNKRCSAKSSRTGKPCQAWAVVGTNVCVAHGGAAPQVKAKALVRRAVATYGLPTSTTDPLGELLGELSRTSGHVAWLSALVAQLDHDDETGKSELRQWHASGEGGHWEPSVWLRLYGEERDRLIKVAKTCLDAGVAERQVRIAEQQGELVAGLLRRVLEGVGVDPSSELARQVVRRELTTLAGVTTE